GPSELFLGVPVNQLAYSQCKQLELIQMAKLAGSQLLEFILVAVNAGVAASVIEASGWVPRLADRADRLSTRVGTQVDLALSAAVVAGFYFWGQAELSRLASATSLTPDNQRYAFMPPVPLAVVQGNVTIEEERLQSVSAGEICERYIALSSG